MARKELETENVEMETATRCQLFALLLRPKVGWFANQALQRSARLPLFCIRGPWASRSLSLGRDRVRARS